jgi:toxin ParE1/3/4
MPTTIRLQPIATAFLAACARLADFPNRGSVRDDVRPGLRTIAFERRAVIVYFVEESEVRVARILHHGRDLHRAFQNPES